MGESLVGRGRMISHYSDFDLLMRCEWGNPLCQSLSLEML